MGKGYLSLPKRGQSAWGYQSDYTQLESRAIPKQTPQLFMAANTWSIDVEHLEGAQQKNF